MVGVNSGWIGGSGSYAMLPEMKIVIIISLICIVGILILAPILSYLLKINKKRLKK